MHYKNIFFEVRKKMNKNKIHNLKKKFVTFKRNMRLDCLHYLNKYTLNLHNLYFNTSVQKLIGDGGGGGRKTNISGRG